jgi:hypothetical protein
MKPIAEMADREAVEPDIVFPFSICAVFFAPRSDVKANRRTAVPVILSRAVNAGIILLKDHVSKKSGRACKIMDIPILSLFSCISYSPELFFGGVGIRCNVTIVQVHY